jgi:hypothetical protein
MPLFNNQNQKVRGIRWREIEFPTALATSRGLSLELANETAIYHRSRASLLPPSTDVCTENLIQVADVMESPKLTE